MPPLVPLRPGIAGPNLCRERHFSRSPARPKMVKAILPKAVSNPFMMNSR
jgi:hypothetical protein